MKKNRADPFLYKEKVYIEGHTHKHTRLESFRCFAFIVVF